MHHKIVIPSIAFGAILSTLTPLNARSQVWIEERHQAVFPLTLIPDSRKKIILKPNGSIGANTTAEVVGGSAVSGHYYVSSDSERTITIDVLSNNDDQNIKLKNFKVKYLGKTYNGLPASGLPSPGQGTDLYIGFTAILKSGAEEGERYPSYTIDIVED